MDPLPFLVLRLTCVWLAAGRQTEAVGRYQRGELGLDWLLTLGEHRLIWAGQPKSSALVLNYIKVSYREL
jgi:hypothetical protein